MACCTARQVKLKRIATAKATAKAKAAVAKTKRTGIPPKKAPKKPAPKVKVAPKKAKPCTICTGKPIT